VSRDVADLSVHHLDLIVHGAPCLLTSADALQVSRSCRHALVVLCSRTVRRVSGPVPGGHAALRLYSSLYRKRLEVVIAPAAPAQERGASNCLSRVQASLQSAGPHTVARCTSQSLFLLPLFRF
jgi:hypothetical protein